MAAPVARIAVLGLGRSGDAVVRWALDRPGATPADVVVFVEHDTPRLRESAARLRQAGVRVELGAGTVPGTDWDLIVASPGIAPSRPLMRSAARTGAPVISELELAYRLSSAPFVAVTGTNGKTTTTALITHLLRESGMDAVSVGNIGVPALTAAPAVAATGVVVAECSSFQLTLTADFHPKVAVLLNITPDHVDWHGSLQAYEADKAKVFDNLRVGDAAVVDVDDARSCVWADAVAARGVRVVRVGISGGNARVDGALLVVDTGQGDTALIRADELLIRGVHNISNALAASAAALLMGASAQSVRAGLASFEPIEHRLDPVGTVAGVEYVNDSKATNPDAVMKALTAFGSTPLLILLGGRNKGNDFLPLAEACGARCRLSVLYGECRAELEAAFAEVGAPFISADTMMEALTRASSAALPGEVVLLSPACASFDEFSDYEDRGRRFAEAVRRMAGEPR